VGRLFVRVRTACFSGYGSIWAQPEDIGEFATKLGAYPIDADDPPSLRWGLDDCQRDNLILDIKITPADSVGNLLVAVELADMYEPHERVRTSFRTTYSELQAFRDALPAFVRGEEARATLLGKR
jgi:hypothetical protein